MSEPASISAGIAARYATAIFDIAQSNDALSGLQSSVQTLETALAESEDLRSMIASPLISRSEQTSAIVSVAEKMELTSVLTNGLGLMAEKRRLFVLPQLLAALRAMIDEAQGVVTADVASAAPLTGEQTSKLVAALSEKTGKTVTINATVDDTLIGGLVVKVGSKMIDTTIRSKLASLQNAMKEVG